MKKRKTWLIIGAIVIVIAVLGVAGWKYHENPQFCGICHIMDRYVESWQGSTELARAHAEVDVTCLDCHEPTIEQQIDELITFISGDYPPRLQQRKFENEWCFRCHEHESREAVAALTADFVYDGVNVNPHTQSVDLDNPEDPHGSGDHELDCYRCHIMHRDSPGIEYCFGCHHTYELISCSTVSCHDEEAEEGQTSTGF